MRTLSKFRNLGLASLLFLGTAFGLGKAAEAEQSIDVYPNQDLQAIVEGTVATSGNPATFFLNSGNYNNLPFTIGAYKTVKGTPGLLYDTVTLQFIDGAILSGTPTIEENGALDAVLVDGVGVYMKVNGASGEGNPVFRNSIVRNAARAVVVDHQGTADSDFPHIHDDIIQDSTVGVFIANNGFPGVVHAAIYNNKFSNNGTGVLVAPTSIDGILFMGNNTIPGMNLFSYANNQWSIVNNTVQPVTAWDNCFAEDGNYLSTEVAIRAGMYDPNTLVDITGFRTDCYAFPTDTPTPTNTPTVTNTPDPNAPTPTQTSTRLPTPTPVETLLIEFNTGDSREYIGGMIESATTIGSVTRQVFFKFASGQYPLSLEVDLDKYQTITSDPLIFDASTLVVTSGARLDAFFAEMQENSTIENVYIHNGRVDIHVIEDVTGSPSLRSCIMYGSPSSVDYVVGKRSQKGPLAQPPLPAVIDNVVFTNIITTAFQVLGAGIPEFSYVTVRDSSFVDNQTALETYEPPSKSLKGIVSFARPDFGRIDDNGRNRFKDNALIMTNTNMEPQLYGNCFEKNGVGMTDGEVLDDIINNGGIIQLGPRGDCQKQIPLPSAVENWAFYQ